MTAVYLDSSAENMVPELALHAQSILDADSGDWARPIATAAQFASFLDRWRENDPNGEWAYATEADGNIRLHYGDEQFPVFGVSEAGDALYDLTGWPWVIASDQPAGPTGV